MSDLPTRSLLVRMPLRASFVAPALSLAPALAWARVGVGARGGCFIRL